MPTSSELPELDSEQ